MKKIFLAGLAILSMSTAAFAGPIDLPPDGGVYIKFNNFELADLGGILTGDAPTNSLVIPGGYDGTNTQGNWGVALIKTLDTGVPTAPHDDLDLDSPPIFADIFSGGQITAIFGGIQLTSLHTATGGWMDLWWHDSTGLGDPTNININLTAPTAASVAKLTTDNGGVFLARINFTPGVLGTASDGNDCTTTIFTQSVLNGTGVGVANSFADIDTTKVGAWTSTLNGDWFDNPCGARSDVRFKNSYELLNAGPWKGDYAAGGNIIGLRSDDPARAFTVPEPMTLGLLGMGLAGLGVRMRRRTNVN